MSHIFIRDHHTDQEALKDLEKPEHEHGFDQAFSGKQSWWDKTPSMIQPSDLIILTVSSDFLNFSQMYRP